MPLETAPDYDWSNVSEDMAREIINRSETYMHSQLQVALAADLRAVTMASIFATFATALAGASLAYWSKTGDLAILLGGLAATIMLTASAGFGYWAARPVDFYFPGSPPDSWFECRLGRLHVALGGMAEQYQPRITHNAQCLQENGKALAKGVKIAAFSPLIAVAVWCFAAFIFPSSPEAGLSASQLQLSEGAVSQSHGSHNDH